MERLPRNFKSITCTLEAIRGKGVRGYLSKYDYKTSDGIDGSFIVQADEWIVRPDFSDVIVEEEDFVEGFKRVRLENGEYGYIREIDGTLLPYRFDIASDFNEYGFAMVGKGCEVAWIDKAFNYLNMLGHLTPCPHGYKRISMEHGIYGYTNSFSEHGWTAIADFSDGEYPLSLMLKKMPSGPYTSYMTKEGSLQKFYDYDGAIRESYHTMFGIENYPKDMSIEKESFDSDGTKVLATGILYARGYFCSLKNILELGENGAMVHEIEKDIIEKQKTV